MSFFVFSNVVIFFPNFQNKQLFITLL